MQLIRFITILYIFQALLMGGVTGKVSGRVIDSNTNEALIGANVMLVGTSLGAATDEDGYYHILNVPPGFYDLRSNMIGYAEKTITGVAVGTGPHFSKFYQGDGNYINPIDWINSIKLKMCPELKDNGNVTVSPLYDSGICTTGII